LNSLLPQSPLSPSLCRQKLLSGENLHFGNPLLSLSLSLLSGSLHPLSLSRTAAGLAARRSLWDCKLLEWERRLVARGVARLQTEREREREREREGGRERERGRGGWEWE
jgi:hypothetical protein